MSAMVSQTLGRRMISQTLGREVAYGDVVRYAFYLEGVSLGCVCAFVCGARYDAYFSCLVCATHEAWGATPLYYPRVGTDGCIADDCAFSLYGEGYLLTGETPNVAIVVGDFGYYDDEVGAISHERPAHLIGMEPQPGATTRRHLLLTANDLAVFYPLCHEPDVLPLAVGVALLTRLPEVPEAGEFED